MSAPAFTIPRKGVGESAAHLKETGTNGNLDSEWDIPVESQRGAGARTTKWTALSTRFDRALPPHKRYFGRISRRTLLIIMLAAFLALLALIIGLAVGLSSGSTSKHANLPLPSNAQVFTGDLTYYTPGLGACGYTSSETDLIVSISHFVYEALTPGANPNAMPLCGKMVRARRVNEEGKMASVDLRIVDKCMGCEPTDIDVSPAAFDMLADHGKGRVKVDWAYL